jgi:vitamin B12 transport system substrate-binding protein
VSLAPHLTEQLFAIGAGDRIVGTTEFADYPDAAKRTPRVARAHGVDLERIAALQRRSPTSLARSSGWAR